jgi:hypothetical protein
MQVLSKATFQATQWGDGTIACQLNLHTRDENISTLEQTVTENYRGNDPKVANLVSELIALIEDRTPVNSIGPLSMSKEELALREELFKKRKPAAIPINEIANQSPQILKMPPFRPFTLNMVHYAQISAVSLLSAGVLFLLLKLLHAA